MVMYSKNNGQPVPQLPNAERYNGRTYTDPSQWFPLIGAAAGWAEVPDRPNNDARWSTADGEWKEKPSHSETTQNPPVWNGQAWSVPTKTLNEQKADKAAAIKRKADALVAAGFTYAIPGEDPLDPHTYAILDNDQANMLAVQVRFAKGGTNHHGGFWRCTSNHNVTMSDAEVQAFFDAAYAYKMGIIRNAVVLSDAVRTAANVSALNLINVEAGTTDSSGGWPSNSS